MTGPGATAAVLDTSAVPAWLRDEPGADLVRPLLSAAHSHSRHRLGGTRSRRPGANQESEVAVMLHRPTSR
ncbi:MAG: hypothetical protein ACREQ5_33505 [Candidatus Dormibacteria bacterium]